MGIVGQQIGTGGGGTNAISFRTVTSDTTLTDADSGIIYDSAVDGTITIPTGNTASQVMVVQRGAGKVVVVGDIGVTVEAGGSRVKSSEQNAAIVITRLGVNNFNVAGNTVV